MLVTSAWQVKVNGYRIELAEVEVALGAYPAVEQAVVLVRNGQLAAYVKPRNNATFGANEVAELRRLAGRSLTSYMMPKYAFEHDILLAIVLICWHV